MTVKDGINCGYIIYIMLFSDSNEYILYNNTKNINLNKKAHRFTLQKSTHTMLAWGSLYHYEVIVC